MADNSVALSPLEAAAQQGGNRFFDNYLSLRASGIESEKAWFGAWLMTFEPDRKPATRKELSALLGKSERTLFKWEHEGWFAEMIDRRRDVRLLEVAPAIDEKTIEAALSEKGMVGIQARRLYYDVSEKREQRRKPSELERMDDWIKALKEVT